MAEKLDDRETDWVEKGIDYRMETKRKIILGLGFDLSDKEKIFPEN